jgi:glycosyltransferase involved in cell wall biosynthesis
MRCAPPDLVVFSHLRWSWVWQRPQHLISRLAAERTTWFVEEPLAADVERPCMEWVSSDRVLVARLLVPRAGDDHLGFDSKQAEHIPEALAEAGGVDVPLVWLYTPLALRAAHQLRPRSIVYDVMDDLASFKGASPALAIAQREALATADVVFTGGRSLHAGVAAKRPTGTHLFPSGVEAEHFRRARRARRSGARRVAGYVGVIDERVDLDLVAGLADALPDWEIRMVGPIAKIDPATLPHRPNITYPGSAPYADLPEVMAGFDVALMPFALNEATRSISPTKTLEYLAAGLPVVSTRVPDVVADHASVVELCDDAEAFAGACTTAVTGDRRDDLARRIRTTLHRHHWDRIAASMSALLPGTTAAEMTA